MVNAHPGVSHNYLRNHDFNLWFTIATPPDSELGLDLTLERLMDEAGAESMRALPTLTLFKINMNLEMEAAPTRSPPRSRRFRPARSSPSRTTTPTSPSSRRCRVR